MALAKIVGTLIYSLQKGKRVLNGFEESGAASTEIQMLASKLRLSQSCDHVIGTDRNIIVEVKNGKQALAAKELLEIFQCNCIQMSMHHALLSAESSQDALDIPPRSNLPISSNVMELNSYFTSPCEHQVIYSPVLPDNGFELFAMHDNKGSVILIAAQNKDQGCCLSAMAIQDEVLQEAEKLREFYAAMGAYPCVLAVVVDRNGSVNWLDRYLPGQRDVFSAMLELQSRQSSVGTIKCAMCLQKERTLIETNSVTSVPGVETNWTPSGDSEQEMVPLRRPLLEGEQQVQHMEGYPVLSESHAYSHEQQQHRDPFETVVAGAGAVITAGVVGYIGYRILRRLVIGF